jgi:site-specific DNA-methyltransferase (cytosine-N4-specific)
VRDYGVDGQLGLEPVLEDYLYELVRVFAEVRRVLRDDGTLWINIGDGFTSGGRKSRAPDPKNPNRALSTRPPTPLRLKPKDLLLLPARLVLALQQPLLRCSACGFEDHAMKFGHMPAGADICPNCSTAMTAEIAEPGWYVRSEIIWEKPNCTPESVTDRPTRAHEHIWLLTKSKEYLYDGRARRGPNGRNLRTVWTINVEKGRHGHVAPFPEELARRCIELGSRPGNLVLDPFLGSGTTAVVARSLERQFCGIELNPDYADAAARRLRAGSS